MEFQHRATSSHNHEFRPQDDQRQTLTHDVNRVSTAPERSPGELFAFSQKVRRKESEPSERSDCSWIGRHAQRSTSAMQFLDRAEAWHEQVSWQQSRRELRLAQFERKKHAIEESAINNREALVEKIKTQDRRQLQFQRQLAAANQSKAFIAQQQRNEQQKLRRELLQSRAAHHANVQRKKEEMLTDEADEEGEDSEGRPDICRTILSSHMQRNKELEHARQFVRNNERLNDAYWCKMLPEGRIQHDGADASRQRLARGTRAPPSKSFSSSNIDRRSRWQSVRLPSDRDLDDSDSEANNPWDTFWDNWNRVHSRYRKQQASDYDAAHQRRTVIVKELEEKKDKKQEQMNEKASAVRIQMEHRKSRAMKKQASINAIHQAAFEETQQRLIDNVAKIQRKQEQKLNEQEANRRERAVLGKEARIAAEKIAYATELEHRSRQIAKEERSNEVVRKKLTDMKERAALIAVRHQTKSECAIERKNAALDSFQLHARAGFEKNEEKHANIQRSAASSTGDQSPIHGGSFFPRKKKMREPAAADLLALVGSQHVIKAITPAAESVAGNADKAFAEIIREELSKHLRIVGMNLKNVWKIMDLNGNGLVSMSEFQSGLKDVSWDPVTAKLGSPRACFMALGGGASQLTPAMFVGPTAEEISPVSSPHHKGAESDEPESPKSPEPLAAVRLGKRKAVSSEPSLKPEESEEEEQDDAEGDDDEGRAPWAATEEDFVRAVETSLKKKNAKKKDFAEAA
eukprot:gnl/MRDRNA2_/MRDRNA2_109816_c0_seq1.p1 gnl/MRDRNA2_/MRDRNA2_109816_c0~~gnl/MRDRNA2_/MRDRNA2_109816_c0_seq1.p1  ORF type:complete len:746 (+),score=185.29 gnl/MRDRNA2_/MRDRNA2_109816_c0_seq1:64-2301(+)